MLGVYAVIMYLILHGREWRYFDVFSSTVLFSATLVHTTEAVVWIATRELGY